ncbi:MAG: hypothetical protein HYU28_01715 [Actinobacteria bacterium]|nr:hypothetical protein [Actinomycetota bacterium]
MSAQDEPSEHTHENAPRHHDECYACPVGGLFLTARGASPEAVEHLVNAAGELLAAMRSVLEAAETFVETQRGTPVSTPEPKIRRIDLDGAS